MKNHKITKNQIGRLHNAVSINNPDIRKNAVDKILEEIVPSESKVIEPEVGKYYEYFGEKDEKHIVFKATHVEKTFDYQSLRAFGYGLDLKDKEFSTYVWVDEEDITETSFKEIDKEDFLYHIKEYAVNVLGFVKGVKFKNIRTGFIQTIENDNHFTQEESVFCGETLKKEWRSKGSDSNARIFKDGKFAEIVTENTKESLWEKTMDLRWQEKYDANAYLSSMHNKVLQQKLVDKKTGEEKWEDVY